MVACPLTNKIKVIGANGDWIHPIKLTRKVKYVWHAEHTIYGEYNIVHGIRTQPNMDDMMVVNSTGDMQRSMSNGYADTSRMSS